MTGLDEQIGQWRTFVASQRAIEGTDVDEMEDHLRGQIDDLRDLGYPDGDEDTLEAIYPDTEDVLASWEDDPSQALDDTRMAPINERLGDYGLTECAG